MKLLSVLLWTVGVFFAPYIVLAHSWGTSFETEDNGYSIDIGYSTPAPEVGESVIFDFEILKGGERFRDFSDVWVRVEGEHGTVLATGVHNADFGGARMSYVFPGRGEYQISARYEKGVEAVAEAEFPISVVAASTSGEPSPLWWALGGIVLGLGGAVFLKGRRL